MYDYPYWKILAWRFVRTAVSGGISMIVLMNITIQPDWSNAQLVLKTVSAAFMSGFISAAALFIRDNVSDGDKKADIQKMPL